MPDQMENAYLTVYMAMILAVILSLCLTLIEGTRKNAFYLEAECITDIGLNSVLAEYHQELLNRYNLFAIDSSYGTVLPRVQNVGNRSEFYLKKNMSYDDIFLEHFLYRDLLGMKLKHVEIKRARLLTDGNGSVFRRRAAEAVLDDLNLSLLEEWNEWIQTVTSKQLTEQNIEAQKRRLDAELEEYERREQISETKWITVTVDNPTDYLETMRRKGILNLAVEDTSVLSTKYFQPENLIQMRMQANGCNRGNLPLEENNGMNEIIERFLFQEYLLRYLDSYRAESNESDKGGRVSDHVLTYQVEYLLAGKTTDMENLKYTVNCIFAIREAANTAYLYSDQEKCAAAETFSAVLCTLTGLPEASDVLKQILLLGWAFAESLYDIKCLMAGGHIPLIKCSDNWHYGLDHALHIGGITPENTSEGMDYADYLRVLLAMEEKDKITIRAMNMVEADIRNTPGNEAFRLDGCIDALEISVHIQSAYGYDCEIMRQKGYSTQ